MTLDPQALISELKPAIETGRLILFVGSGISSAAGIPSGKEIIERLQQSAERAVDAMGKGQGKAKESVGKAKSVGASLRNIAQAVSSINGMNLQIASAAEEQSSVSEEISRNVENISGIANEAAENTKQITLTSESLARLAMELQDLVAHFKLTESPGSNVSVAG